MPSRRQLLAISGGLLTTLAGCGSDDAGTDSGTPTVTDRGTSTTGIDGNVTIGVERDAYLFHAEFIPRSVIGPQEHQTTTLSELDDTTRDAVQTAITEERYTTSDPSTALLDGIDDVSLLEYQDTYYVISHTFPTHTLVLESVVPENAPADRTVSRNSRRVQEIEVIREPILTILPSPSSPGEPYVTTQLSDTLRDFLDQYDYLRYPGGIGELVLRKTVRAPPHTVTAAEASDQRLYNRDVHELESFTETSRQLIRETLNDQQKTPLWRAVGSHRVFPGDIPQRLLEAGQLTVTVDGAMYNIRADHIHWSDLPFEISASVVDDSLSSEASARIELQATNRWPEAAKLAMPGIAPFGVLRAYGPDGEQLLWTPEYEQSDDVVLENGTLRPQSPAEVSVSPDERVQTVYEFGWVAEQITAGSYVVPGVVWAEWPTEPGQHQPERDWRSDLFPYTLTLDVRG